MTCDIANGDGQSCVVPAKRMQSINTAARGQFSTCHIALHNQCTTLDGSSWNCCSNYHSCLQFGSTVPRAVATASNLRSIRKSRERLCRWAGSLSHPLNSTMCYKKYFGQCRRCHARVLKVDGIRQDVNCKAYGCRPEMPIITNPDPASEPVVWWMFCDFCEGATCNKCRAAKPRTCGFVEGQTSCNACRHLGQSLLCMFDLDKDKVKHRLLESALLRRSLTSI